jgi:hypothetical protein
MPNCENDYDAKKQYQNDEFLRRYKKSVAALERRGHHYPTDTYGA